MPTIPTCSNFAYVIDWQRLGRLLARRGNGAAQRHSATVAGCEMPRASPNHSIGNCCMSVILPECSRRPTLPTRGAASFRPPHRQAKRVRLACWRPPKRDAGRQESPATRVRCVDDRSPRTAINPPTTSILPSRYLKLCTRLVMVRLHPSTSTNSSNLKGREIMAGGNMNMPMLMSTLATTASMMMNGR